MSALCASYDNRRISGSQPFLDEAENPEMRNEGYQRNCCDVTNYVMLELGQPSCVRAIIP
jgi:phenylalanyl-tRNA synthetase beta subunit